ncbi:glutamyl-tRNA reductase-binding protein, chloroplastic isoform X12 [Alnus glutinosa]|uniref:glutamyl-tRNA reductase-binding protein, chloroplastic isoform X12 n=1 Tax=Alnus glutinosa TaxID=3517 RepID=UPI002D7920B8|nr:glutamyl-tRNA reductase-binding protein, chloroplastic isoform X12 [Alnus glutinosa]
MLLQTQSLATHFAPSLTFSKPITKTQFTPPKPNPFRQSLFRALKCSLSVVLEPMHLELRRNKPFPAEVSRTIMELASVGTLSTLTEENWPLGIGVRFAVDEEGTPVLCLNASNRQFSIDKRSSLHVQQLEQCGLRTTQCTIQGSLDKPEDRMVLKLHSLWKKRFGEEVDEDLIYVVAVERVLQIENFEVSEAKVIWVDRLGFDMRLFSPQKGVFEARVPFPSEVMDEKGAKSTFNCMSQLAWEVEKNFHVLDFQKVKQLKQIS